ncbi:ATP-binding cassette domain-containing protein [Streptomyces silvisoli]|uniref:ATP-binding cassette domain-containing protein n=1 Tax=Streptomyces silvisoli TaxID=3034235 RepID=A0ABT5ZPH3_9ACTN|nr:ATP-binding cassette domain-containing protein [Streptomyces silvisoli]MDF3291732.1 ATP-binding cassette domain-containing protein [Streptomyces silvisoli]
MTDTSRLLHSKRIVRIGRAPDNDVVVRDLMASRYHAELHTTEAGGFEVVDLGSSNGTYVNGRAVERCEIGPSDLVGIGQTSFQLDGDRLVERGDAESGAFTARDLTVRERHRGEYKTLLDSVSIDLPEKSLVAIVGPSGSGKSTLLRALTGYRPADSGEVLYDGRDLYQQFAELRHRIGLVPQDDILHPQLTVMKALRYAARLRFPHDTDAAERDARVTEVLAELGLSHRAENRITALSGGQRKRVSVALELLTKPALLLLDEPTSGLDPGLDRQVMQMLRGLADGGRRIAVVTHSVANLHMCDRLLVLAPGGRTAYFGPPQYALEFFGHDDWADVFRDFDQYPDRDWAAIYRQSIHHRTYSAGKAEEEARSTESERTADGPAEQPQGVPSVRPPKPPSWGSQLVTLVRRNFSVIVADRGHVGLLAALPLIMGVLSAAVPAAYGFMAASQPAGRPLACGPIANVDAQCVLLVLAIGACLTGTANSVRELVQERVIYQRDRATGLSRSAYVLSKVTVLGVITAAQGLILAVIGLAGRKLPTAGLVTQPSAIELVLVVVLLAITSMMLGLIISALVRTAEKTMPLLVVSTVAQVMFTGAIFPMFNDTGLAQLSWLSPSRWAVAAQAATIDLTRIGPPADAAHPKLADPLWAHTAAQWSMDVSVLVGLGVMGVAVVTGMLRRHEPQVMRRR